MFQIGTLEVFWDVGVMGGKNLLGGPVDRLNDVTTFGRTTITFHFPELVVNLCQRIVHGNFLTLRNIMESYKSFCPHYCCIRSTGMIQELKRGAVGINPHIATYSKPIVSGRRFLGFFENTADFFSTDVLDSVALLHVLGNKNAFAIYGALCHVDLLHTKILYNRKACLRVYVATHSITNATGWMRKPENKGVKNEINDWIDYEL